MDETGPLMLTKTHRPKYLNLLKIRLPVTGVASILHRISGVLLFLSIPFIIYALSLSLRSPESFAQVSAYFDNILIRVIALILLYSLVHHFFAGIRFLLLDLDIGAELRTARASALSVILAGLLAFVLIVMGILL
ncbi:Succinate dehydrogenase cytochrome b-556 subunit [hydrothermal vent metagenome]|uniref:Succinate dehydrogenase cytochrome b-556 subunit n=1 Tax=hydrothermal vent metagenome TaxID=652676 RepID=A0A3B1BUM3_9ZZZZ